MAAQHTITITTCSQEIVGCKIVSFARFNFSYFPVSGFLISMPKNTLIGWQGSVANKLLLPETYETAAWFK